MRQFARIDVDRVDIANEEIGRDPAQFGDVQTSDGRERRRSRGAQDRTEHRDRGTIDPRKTASISHCATLSRATAAEPEMHIPTQQIRPGSTGERRTPQNYSTRIEATTS
jgi:hypothetical protein